MDLRSGLRLLADQWKLIVAAIMCSATISGVLTAQTTPQYASQITLFVSAWSDPGDPMAAYQGSLLSQQKVKSYNALLTGHQVMSGVVDRLKLSLTTRELAEQVTTATIPDTALLTATVTDPSPTTARMIATAIGEEFVALVPVLESSTDAQRSPVRVTVVGPAEEPLSPVTPRPARNLALAIVLGMLVGFALAVIRRSLDTSVKSAEQLGEISAVPTLGNVPFDRTAEQQPLIGSSDYGPRGEAFRKIRTNLQFMDVDRPHKVLLVTSPLPNDGKSVTACCLAVSLTETGKRVLLVDADLRRPSIAGYLGIPAGLGLTSVLVGTAKLKDAIQQWGDPAISVLASGPLPPNPSELLGSRQMRELIEDLRGLFDAVIIDAPPVLPVADAPAVAAVCDGVALVVAHGKSRHDQVREAVAALGKAEVPVLGTVLNMVPQGRRTSYDYRSAYQPADVTAPRQQPQEEPIDAAGGILDRIGEKSLR